MKFYLVRHGDKEKIMGDLSLSVLGINQAQKLAQYFSSLSIDRFFPVPGLKTVDFCLLQEVFGKRRLDNAFRKSCN